MKRQKTSTTATAAPAKPSTVSTPRSKPTATPAKSSQPSRPATASLQTKDAKTPRTRAKADIDDDVSALLSFDKAVTAAALATSTNAAELQSPPRKRALDDDMELNMDNLPTEAFTQPDMNDANADLEKVHIPDSPYKSTGLCEKNMVATGANISVAQRARQWEEIKKQNEQEDWKSKLEAMAQQNAALVKLKREMDLKTKEMEQKAKGLEADLEREMVSKGEVSKDLDSCRALLEIKEKACRAREEEIYKLKTNVLKLEQALSDSSLQLTISNMVRKYLHTQMLTLKKNIRVYCRVRPYLPHEAGYEAGNTLANASATCKSYGNLFVFPESMHPGLASQSETWKQVLLTHKTQEQQRLAECEKSLNEGSYAAAVSVSAFAKSNDDLPAYLANNTVRDKVGIKTEEKALTSNKINTKIQQYKFDRVFNPYDSNADVYADVDELIETVVDGNNVTIFAYGQTGAGKTFTMEGTGVFPISEASRKADVFQSGFSYAYDENTGLMYRSIHTLFTRLQLLNVSGAQTCVRLHLLEVYNDQVFDLMPELEEDVYQNRGVAGNINRFADVTPVTNPRKVDIKLMKTSELTMFPLPSDTEDKMEVTVTTRPICVSNVDEMYSLISLARARRVRCTAMNERSSRSHLIVRIYVDYQDAYGNMARSMLNLIDLCGSERMNKTGLSGDGAAETIEINKGLTALGDVIVALNNPSERKHVPYRNNTLTHMLQPCLEAKNAKTLMIVNCSAVEAHINETLSSLRFANKVNSCVLNK